jgi:hypothetical protein
VDENETGEEQEYDICAFQKSSDGKKEEEERLLKWLVTITNGNNGQNMKGEVLVLAGTLYLDANINDKVNTMTVHIGKEKHVLTDMFLSYGLHMN